MNLDEAFVQTCSQESIVDHMYLDTHRDLAGNPAGKVTIGPGVMIPNEAAATAMAPRMLVRVDVDTTMPAPVEIVTEDFRAVSVAPFGMIADKYRTYTRSFLPDDQIRSLFDERASYYHYELCKLFNAFPEFPDPAQLAIFDMAWNMGVDKIRHGFPRFCQCVLAQDWKGAAAECRRDVVTAHGDARNVMTKALFLKAAT